jgi:hypothetical protein
VYPKKKQWNRLASGRRFFSQRPITQEESTANEHSTFATSTALKPDFGDSAGPNVPQALGTGTDEFCV